METEPRRDEHREHLVPLPTLGHAEPRALVWDSWNTASLLAARSLRARGLAVDFLLPRNSPWAELPSPGGEVVREPPARGAWLERAIFHHPLDVLCLHGDDQVRWLLERASRLPHHLRRHLPPSESLALTLSKERTLALGERLGLPVPKSRLCRTWREVQDAARACWGPSGAAVVKPEQGSAGRGIYAVRPTDRLSQREWASLCAEGPVLVQPLLLGRRALATVVYERGAERASCVHEKVCAGPGPFGISAEGVTRHIEAVHEQAAALFGALAWHGPANAEFREERLGGRWLLMEINPRIPSSIGIQAEAGLDVVSVWADVCLGRRPEAPPRGYRDGARYCWAVPDLASALRRPWRLGGVLRALTQGSDWGALPPGQRRRALRMSLRAAVRG